LVPVSAHDILGGPTDDRTAVSVVHVSSEMVADLHEPRLVISPGYVGRERRHLPVRLTPPATTRPSIHRWAQAVVVALVTAAAVVPLTLMVAHGAPTATEQGGATRAQVHLATSRPGGAASVARSARAAAREARSTDRATARSAKAAAVAERRAARSARAWARAVQRSVAQAARATRRAEAQAARTARQASKARSTSDSAAPGPG
jgi:hypothetical protein